MQEFDQIHLRSKMNLLAALRSNRRRLGIASVGRWREIARMSGKYHANAKKGSRR